MPPSGTNVVYLLEYTAHHVVYVGSTCNMLHRLRRVEVAVSIREGGRERGREEKVHASDRQTLGKRKVCGGKTVYPDIQKRENHPRKGEKSQGAM